MVVVAPSRDEGAELEQLERLWNAPAADVRPEPHRLTRWLAAHGWRVLSFAWPAVLLSLFLAPTPADETAVPWYAWTLLGVFWLSLVGMLAAALGSFGGPLRWSLVAGALGVALGVGCLTTGHHASAYGIYELGAFSALTLFTAGTLAARRGT
jgi:hypothetical protein